jgi:V8-like Glu-specific endopeptidase
MDTSKLLLMILILISTLATPINAQEKNQTIQTKADLSIYGGTLVPVGELEAVGQLNGGSCTATLITYDKVLTAAHCVCPNSSPIGCDQRAAFILKNVFPVDNPNTPVDESTTRTDVTIAGNVRVNPEFGLRGWLREDNAVVELDQPANQLAKIAPIDVEYPHKTPLEGDILTIVGYGLTGLNCKNPDDGKRRVDLPASASNWGGIKFDNPNAYSCPGDSGGPILNADKHVVGTASWGDSDGDSTYRPTSFVYNWIFEIPQPGWISTTWVGIEQNGINSHQPSQFCPDGSFVTALDLDGDKNVSGWDSPIIGQARCSKLVGEENSGYSSSAWYNVWKGGINPHQPTTAWCPQGSYITGLDLDSVGVASAWDSPVVGQVQCSKLAGYTNWGSSYWIDIERAGINSHQPEEWCLDGSFLTQFDLDSDGTLEAWDSPIIGRAKCSRPAKDISLSYSVDDNYGLAFTTGGTNGDASNWFGQKAVYHFGGNAAQSGKIPDDGSTWMQTMVTGPGTLRFFWSVSSQTNYDYLEFYIDGVLQDRISGSVPWQQKSYVISDTGKHTLKWQYIKDGSLSLGSDTAWVDSVNYNYLIFLPIVSSKAGGGIRGMALP